MTAQAAISGTGSSPHPQFESHRFNQNIIFYTRGHHWWKVAFNPTEVVEKDPTCWQALHRLHPTADIKIADMTKLKLEKFKDVVGYVAGCPCPPYSTLGRRKGKKDPRYGVLDYVVEQLEHLGKRNTLKFFVLENVTGMLKSIDGQEPLAHEIKKLLETKLPHFQVHLWTLNCRDYGLPQTRPRVFWIGIAREVLEAAEMTELAVPHPHPQVYLRDFLDDHEAMPDISPMTLKQRKNIMGYQEAFNRKSAIDQNIMVACCDHGRDEKAVFGSFINYEDCMN